MRSGFEAGDSAAERDADVLRVLLVVPLDRDGHRVPDLEVIQQVVPGGE